MTRRIAILAAAAFLLADWAPAQEATIKSLTGDVEMQSSSSKAFVPATVGAKLKTGDFISTGYDATASLAFEDNSEVTVAQMTQLRIDEFLNKDNRTKTQLFLRVGSVQAKVKHAASIRSDFSVVTPTCTASVRGSEERVTYLPGFGTTVEYLEGLGLAQDARGQVTQLRANDTAKVSSAGSLSTPSDVQKDNAAPDLSPAGADSRERGASREFGRVSSRPLGDPSNPNTLVDRASRVSRLSTLVFRYDIVPSR